MTGIVVIAHSENPTLAAELSTAASSLAEPGGCGYLVDLQGGEGGGKGEGVPSRAVRAAGPVLHVRSDDGPVLGNYELTAHALLEASKRKSAQVFLIGATRLGRQVAAKLAVTIGCGVLADVRNLRLAGDSLSGTKPIFAGKFSARVASQLPCIALVPPGAYCAPEGSPNSIENIDLTASSTRVKHLETKAKPKGTVDLKTATIIVAAGRGFKRREDLALVDQLADSLGGAVGASRPLSSDLGWLGEEHHVGLTGLYVRPKLYLAIGISGQVQHVAGIKDSKLIVAINRDRDAPIFQVADYGIVGDLYEVVPALLELLRAQN